MTTFQQRIPPASPRKPTGGVVALGIINIVYSSLFYVCCPGIGLLASPVIFKVTERLMKQQGMTGFHPTDTMRAFNVTYGIVYVVLGAMQIAGGIGILRLREWGRKLSIGTAGGLIAWVLINYAMAVFWFYPQFAEMMERSIGREYSKAQIIGGIAGNTIGILFQLAYPVVLIVCLNLKVIKSQFPAAGSLSG